MAVHYDRSDVVNLTDFGGIDYVIPEHPKRHALDEVLPKLVLLNWMCGKPLVRAFHTFKRYSEPFDWNKYHVASFVDFDEKTDRGRQQAEKWLRSLPVARAEKVYVYHITERWEERGCPVFVVSWDDFASDVWYYNWSKFDVATVIDDSARWAVIMGPEAYAIYVVEGPVDRQLPKSDPAYGLGLLRVKPGISQDSNESEQQR